jgi:type II secretory pathway predicted ATPase ExeA
MYLSFYRLKVKPFQNSTNPSFFWLGEMHKEALAIFKYGILKMPGILVLTGDVGTGKTTLINVLINDLGANFIVVKVPDPDLEEIDFVNSLSDTLDFNEKYTSKDMFYRDFLEFLGKSSRNGKKVLLVIDECQRLCSPLLEAITTLAALEKGTKKSCTVLLIGQNDFNDVVMKNNHSALSQLISINYAIEPLNLSETGEFIKHRLRIAGAKKEIFTPDAITKIYQFSAGIPRRINIICDHVLLIGFAKETETVNAALVKSCVEDLHPQGLSKQSNSDPLNAFANEDFRYLRTIPTEPREKIPVNRVWKIFGIIFLMSIPVFLTIFFTDATTFRDFADFFKPGEMQILHTEKKEEMESLNGPPKPDQEKASTQQRALQNTAMLPENRVSENGSAELPVAEDLTDENSPSVSALLNDRKTVATIQTAIKSSRQDGQPTVQDQQGAANEHDTIHNRILPATADASQSATGTPYTEGAKSEKEIVVENGSAPADIAPAETEKNSINDASDSKVSEESSQGANEFLAKQNEFEVNSRVPEDTEQNARTEISDSLITSDKPGETKEVEENFQENFDQGAIIDWVIKNRSE